MGGTPEPVPGANTPVLASALSVRKGHFGGPWSWWCLVDQGRLGLPAGLTRPLADALCSSPITGAPSVPATDRSDALATPNYSYEKRQRELAKKRKAEEKRSKKTTRPDDQPGHGPDNGSNPPDGNTSAPADPPSNP